MARRRAPRSTADATAGEGRGAAPDEARRAWWRRWAGRLWPLGIALVAAVGATRPEPDTDAFWHFALGRAVLEEGSRIVPEPYAFESFTSPVVVPEWLWGVTTYGLFEGLGPASLWILVAATAALSAWLVTRVAAEWGPDASPTVLALASALAVTVVAARLSLRPHLVAAVVLPGFLLLTRRFLRARGASRWRWGAGLVLLELLWAQCHGSFVLAPLLFGVLVAPHLFIERDVASRQAGLAVLGALVAGLVSSAFGLELLGYLLAHGSGEGTAFIADMKPATTLLIDPSRGPPPWALGAVVVLGALGMARSGRWFGGELALFLLWAGLGLHRVRFLAELAPLTVPLLVRAGAALLGPLVVRTRGIAVALTAIAMLAASLLRLHAIGGPLGHPGWPEGATPVAGSRALAALPVGSHVLTTYLAGAPLGYWHQGRLRTFVDGRTPLHFDDTDYGIYRDVFRDPRATARAVVRYGAIAAVVRRDQPACAWFARHFSAVAVEATFSTFVRRSAPDASLRVVLPCGRVYLGRDACTDAGRQLDRDVAALRSLGDTAFVRMLAAERIARCGGDLQRALALVPSLDEAARFSAHRAVLLARLRSAQGDPEGVVAALEGRWANGEFVGTGLVGPLTVGDAARVRHIRRALERGTERARDETPPEARALLAWTCAIEQDATCARENGVRALLGGATSAVPALRWVAEFAPSPVDRADASAWLATLRSMPTAAAPAIGSGRTAASVPAPATEAAGAGGRDGTSRTAAAGLSFELGSATAE